MPGVTIEARRAYTPDAERALIDAVARAITRTLRIAESTLALRLVVHEPRRFPLPSDKDDRFVLVTIDCFEGRPASVKRSLYAELAREMAVCGVPADHLKILLRESSRESWGIRGVPASDVHLEHGS